MSADKLSKEGFFPINQGLSLSPPTNYQSCNTLNCSIITGNCDESFDATVVEVLFSKSYNRRQVSSVEIELAAVTSVHQQIAAPIEWQRYSALEGEAK